MKEPVFTSRELDVMSVLWRESSGTVAEVRERLSDDLAYTTVLWVLQTLEEKGYVRHEREGRAHRYIPLVESEAAGASALWPSQAIRPSRTSIAVARGSAAE